MPIQITATALDLLPELSRFLSDRFGSDLPERFLEPAFLKWKFIDERPDWPGPRSFVVQDRNQVVAHVNLWPGCLTIAGRAITSVHPTDWSAHPAYPGTGFALMRQLLRSIDVGIVAGGSADSRELLPKMGFRSCSRMQVYSRIVRPWRAATTDGRLWGLKSAARMIRNTVRSLEPRRPAPRGWSTGAVDDRLSAVQELVDRPTSSTATAQRMRSPASLRYLLRCPGSNSRLAYLARHGEICGYFMLNRIDAQCRIVDIYVDSDRDDDWQSAYTLALLTAMDDNETGEVIAATSLPQLGGILTACGMRLLRQKPVLLFERAGRQRVDLPLSLQLADSDAFCYPQY